MKRIAILATLALAGTAHAEQVDDPQTPPTAQRWSIDVGSHIRSLGDTSAAILTTEPLSGVRMTVGRRLTSVSAPRRDLDIGVFARWVYAGGSGTFFQELHTEIEQHALTGGIRVDAAVFWRFRIVGQAELGMARTELAITEDEMTPVNDHAWAPYGTATLGADLAIASRPKFRLGLALDLGYTVTVPVDLHALPGDRPDEDLSIATTYASIGKLDTRGFTYSMALRGSF